MALVIKEERGHIAGKWVISVMDGSTIVRQWACSEDNRLVSLARAERFVEKGMDRLFDPCCDNEQRTMAGGCKNCGDPCL